MPKNSRVNLDKLDPQNPLAALIRKTLDAEKDKNGSTVEEVKRIFTGLDNFDSSEEFEFHMWCNDALKLGLLSTVLYHPEPFVLSAKVEIDKEVKLKTKTKTVKAFLMHPHEYTPDFMLEITAKGERFLYDRRLTSRGCLSNYPGPSLRMYVDVKGGFSLYHDDKPFAMNQKWVYDKYKVYIHKVVPKKWFTKTWVPEAALYSPKKHKLKDCYRGCETFKTIKEKLNVQ